MSLTESSMLPLGTKAPNFSLMDTVSGKVVSLSDLPDSKGLVILFICNHCPFVKHVRSGLLQVAKEYKAKGISFVAISSNDPAQYPEDGPDMMAKLAKDLSFPFPYLFDETQDVAKAYHAACTPDIYVFDHELRCVYRGQLDDARPGNDIPVTGQDLRMALNHLLEGTPIDGHQKPSIGCNIKWKR